MIYKILFAVNISIFLFEDIFVIFSNKLLDCLADESKELYELIGWKLGTGVDTVVFFITTLIMFACLKSFVNYSLIISFMILQWIYSFVLSGYTIAVFLEKKKASINRLTLLIKLICFLDSIVLIKVGIIGLLN